MNQETYYCEHCKKEFTISSELASKRGSLCPNQCTRNFQIYLGVTEEQINKRRKEINKPNPLNEIIPNGEMDDEQSGRKGGHRRSSGDSLGLGIGL